MQPASSRPDSHDLNEDRRRGAIQQQNDKTETDDTTNVIDRPAGGGSLTGRTSAANASAPRTNNPASAEAIDATANGITTTANTAPAATTAQYTVAATPRSRAARASSKDGEAEPGSSSVKGKPIVTSRLDAEDESGISPDCLPEA